MTLSNDRPRRGRSRAATTIGLCTVALLATVMVAGSAQADTPTTVLLGTAGQFAVLAGSGITNTGASTIDGDTGSSPTSSETGFAACPGANCVTQTGANHTDPDPNDATTQDAKSALTTAYDDAAGRSPTTVDTELGGQTLVAGVYSSASGTFGMTDTLVLDGENNADAVFIFQTASTLITGGAGDITLIRGAQACNIFWQVGSAATLGAGSTFRGTILAHDDISLGDGVTVDGRLLAGEQASGAGAVTLIHDTITKPTCASGGGGGGGGGGEGGGGGGEAPPPAQPAPSRDIYCDAAGTAYDLVADQDKQPPYDKLGLVPAYVDPVTGSKSCNFPAVAPTLTPTPTPTTTPTPLYTPNAKAAAQEKAAAAKVAAAKASAAARVAAVKFAAAKKVAPKAKASSSTHYGHARPARRHVGLTG